MIDAATAGPHESGASPCASHVSARPKTSISIKLATPGLTGWGGARANTGGARPNAGGARPGTGGARTGCGGPQPGSGRPRLLDTPSPVRAIQARPYGPRWHVVQVRAGTEEDVAKALGDGEARPGRRPRPRYEALHLARPTVQLRRGFWVAVELPILPGYALVRFDAVADNWKPIVSCDGVQRLFMTESERPMPLLDSVVSDLLALCKHERPSDQGAMPHRQPGDMLRVAAGPFTSFGAECVSCDGINTTAMVSIFGRSTPVTLFYEAFEVA